MDGARPLSAADRPSDAAARAAERLLLDHLVTLFVASSGSLCRFDRASGRLVIVAGIELPAEAIGQTIAPGEGVLGWVYRENQPLVLNGDAASDPRFAGRRYAADSTRKASAICWPIPGTDGPVGALSLNRASGKAPFTEADIDQGRAALSLLSIAVENMQLREQAQVRVAELSALNEELASANRSLEQAQRQILQSEKMAAIGQLAAGVAHEINNPAGYVNSNLQTLGRYIGQLDQVLDAYAGLVAGHEGAAAAVAAVRQPADLDYLRQDLRDIVTESLEGVARIKRIVQSLKDFAHPGEGEWTLATIESCLESTLTVVWNELKYKAEVVREFGGTEAVECLPSQIQQVFMNLLVNASHAIEQHGTIRLRTGNRDGGVFCEICDTGCGIEPEHLKRLFEPFFTTKPVGKGTGLGLSISYGIVQRHGGRIEVRSTVGEGSCFTVWLPRQPPRREEGG